MRHHTPQPPPTQVSDGVTRALDAPHVARRDRRKVEVAAVRLKLLDAVVKVVQVRPAEKVAHYPKQQVKFCRKRVAPHRTAKQKQLDQLVVVQLGV